MIHADLNNLHIFGELAPRQYVTDVSKSASIYGKIGLKNKTGSFSAHAEPSINNANPRYQNYGIGFDVAMNINYGKV